MQPSKEHAVTPYIPVPFERGGTAAEEMFKAIRNQVPGYITRRALTGYLAKKGYEGPRRIISKQTDQPDARRAANVLSLFKKDKK